ncbi:MAG TPA: MotA/TolQ/ExbB proton channel family protein [Planctomycetes bacterium]|nr:MotA/TolQ/ExbB proton channel family protein [Planctomycetota bacterium]
MAVITIAIERVWRFRQARIDYDQFRQEIDKVVHSDGLGAAIESAGQVPGPVARVWQTGLESTRLPLPLLREKIEAVAIVEVERLERHLPVLSVIAQVAPLIGILGTVWGMIHAFEGVAGGLALGAGVNGELLAEGIGQALVTTAAGLAVAIPATLAHHYLATQVDGFVSQLERSFADIIELFPRKKKPAPTTTVRAQPVGTEA